ncbi:MAG: type II secretion system GspH family protein [Candidatus Absconditabacterales bacterium]|nr:type II secretion system GspH family protein [Candidatus Absconditabacterales bacterium]
MKKLKAFTILELTIVIVIIGILMAATMKFGGDRIAILNNKNIQEQFLDNFSSLQIQNNMTNYHSGKTYQTLQIKFISKKDSFSYFYHAYDSIIDTGTMFVEGGKYSIEKIILDEKEVSDANIYMKPYTLGCIIKEKEEEGSGDSKNFKISILVNDAKEYCFSIASNNCKIKTISCLGM